VPLHKGDKLVIFSDGWGDNLSNREIAKLVTFYYNDSVKLKSELQKLILRRMRTGGCGINSTGTGYNDGYSQPPSTDNGTGIIVDL
jgi:hypothetical protein